MSQRVFVRNLGGTPIVLDAAESGDIPLGVTDGDKGDITVSSSGTVWTVDVIGTPTAWTPVLKFGGGTTGITYSTQTGTYIQIGKFVIAFLDFSLTSKGSSVGRASIAGLPSTPSVPGGGCITTIGSGGVNTVVAPSMLAWTDGIIYLEQLNITGSPATQLDWNDTDFTNTTNLTGFVNYLVA